ncbi:MAG: tetratricopeptide repeat protein [Cyanobacteria bacterium P01_F01_bin.150]
MAIACEKIRCIAIALHQEIDNRQGEANTWNNLGLVYAQQDRDFEVLDVYERALGLLRGIGDRRGEGITLANIGRIWDQQGNLEIAIVFYKESVNVREQIRRDIRTLSQTSQQAYTSTVADTYRRLSEVLLQEGRIIEAQQVLELLKLEELRDFTRNASGLDADSSLALHALEKSIRDEFGTLASFGHALYECEKARCGRIGALNQNRWKVAEWFDGQVATFVSTIRDNRQTDEFFFDPRYLSETSRDSVAEPGTLLFYPFVLDEKLWLLHTAAGDVAGAVPVEVTQLELGTAVVEFRQALESPTSDMDALKASGHRLYHWLIEPLAKEIQENTIQTLVFAQDRVTRYIPMGALWDGEQYVVKAFTLRIILCFAKM